MYQGTELNFSEVPLRRGQTSPGPLVVGDGADVSALEVRVDALEAGGPSSEGLSRAKGSFLYG